MTVKIEQRHIDLACELYPNAWDMDIQRRACENGAAETERRIADALRSTDEYDLAASIERGDYVGAAREQHWETIRVVAPNGDVTSVAKDVWESEAGELKRQQGWKTVDG